MSDPTDCAFSIAAMVKDWYASPHKSDIPATLIDRRMARFQPSPALAVLAMRERAAKELDSDVEDLKADASRFRQGTDPYHGRMAFAEAAKRQAERIRAIPTTFTNAELLAAAMQLPDVRAMHDALVWHSDDTSSQGDKARAALAPFMKGGE